VIRWLASRPSSTRPSLRDLPVGAAVSPLEGEVASALRSGGALALHDVHHVEREVQIRMALAVANAIETRSALVVEAGTGVGKTYAYLVPALLSGARTPSSSIVNAPAEVMKCTCVAGWSRPSWRCRANWSQARRAAWAVAGRAKPGCRR